VGAITGGVGGAGKKGGNVKLFWGGGMGEGNQKKKGGVRGGEGKELLGLWGEGGGLSLKVSGGQEVVGRKGENLPQIILKHDGRL